jgi:hypothetical protein
MRLLFALLILTSRITVAQTNCSLELDKDSIAVYTCPRADSRYKTIKAVFQIKATRSALAAAVLDISSYKAWQYKTASARVLNRISDRELVYYTEVEAPALTSNRDFVIRLTIDPDPMTNGMIIEAVSIPEYIPPIPNIIRVPFSRARWTVTPAGPGRLAVEYVIDIDLGGSVPPWVVNFFAAKAPYETFKSLRTVIENYRGQRIVFLGD